VLDRFLGREEEAEDVEVELPVEVLRGDAAEGLEVVDASVVDEDIELAEGGFGLGEEAGDVFGVRDVSLDGDGLAAFGLDVGDDGVGACLTAGVVDDD
jgi:hypothetical protein